jgi:hypothetical protein
LDPAELAALTVRQPLADLAAIPEEKRDAAQRARLELAFLDTAAPYKARLRARRSRSCRRTAAKV